ncbi:molybdenum cofactor guanylyltransferase [Geothrix sp. PMB-07]|uniref:molybdenum cofactor guanylyltransferase n=1 Tax=Geothrix sp. PMB-07 TaxID=3068640 RepID=UPI0027413527|nr:NTP transferase domain-containing protein [Geothrix sp. PMB-07]WLT30978.1 NTP transferase domain-containing protein [Geothrix sp. PMB-07]
MKVGLLLLTGGQGSRLGVPKHSLAHPAGPSWGGHLVAVFRVVFPEGPIQILGEPLSDHPELQVVADPRQGPAVALAHWATLPVPAVDLWWVVACDQVRWKAEELQAWVTQAQQADPACGRWVLGRSEGRLQPLGGLLPHGLRSALAASKLRSLWALAESLPHCILDNNLPGWRDVDTPEEKRCFEEESL